MATLPHLGYLKEKDVYLGETLQQMLTAINQLASTVGAHPTGALAPPNAPASLTVAASNGWFDIAINDPNPARAINYFVDYSTTPDFGMARTLFLGPTRNAYIQLGNQTLYWRCHSQFIGSNPSDYTYFGNPPTPVVGGGSSGPTPMPTQGSGSGPSAGANPTPPVGVGFGQYGGTGRVPPRPLGL